MQDWETPIPGFFILAAKRKLKSVAELTDEESKEFMDVLRLIRAGMKEALKIESVILFENENTEHNFHVWLFPRYVWMEKFGNKMKSAPEIVEYAKNNMITDEVIKEVRGCVESMKEYLKIR